MKNPALVLPGALEALHALGGVGLEEGRIPVSTSGLLQLRVGMLAGWNEPSFIRFVGEIRISGETDERLHALSAWRDTPFFTDAERAALALADAITGIADQADPVPDGVWEEAAKYYDERSLAILVLSITTMNMWPRLTVPVGQPAGEVIRTEQVRSRDGTPITLECRGSGPTVIVIDGAMCSRLYGSVIHLVPLLTADFTVYTYDRRGRGDSGDTAPYCVEREIEDLQAVIDATGEQDVGIYGTSSGAVLALEAAAAGVTGIGRLVLCEPPLANADGEADLRRNLGDLLAAGRGGDAVDLFQNSVTLPDELRIGRGSPFWPVVEAVAPTLLYDLTLCAESSVDRYRSVAQPTLVLDTDTDDRLHNDALTVAGALPNARHHAIPSAGVGNPIAAHLIDEMNKFLT